MDKSAPQEFEATLAAAAAAQAQFEEERLDFLQRVQRFLHLYPTTVPFIVLLLGLALGVSVNYSHFVTGSNLSTVLTQVTIVGILGIGQTLVILTAGIDLSVGVIMVISSVVMGRLGGHRRVADLSRLSDRPAAGVAFGALNGFFVTRMRMPPFIVTLGTLIDHRRAQHLLFAERDHRHAGPRRQGAVPADDGHSVRDRRRAHHPRAASCCSCLRPSSGTSSTAPPTAATSTRPATTRRRRGSPASTPTGVLLSVYVLAGLIAAIAGWALIGRIGAISPTAGENANLDSITAVVIGGTRLFGGRGSIVGTLIGALIVGVFRSAVSLAGLDVLWQEFAIGVLIIVAVALDQWIRRISQ